MFSLAVWPLPYFPPGSSSWQARRRRAGAVARARGWYPADRQPVRGAALCAHARRATTMSGNYMFVMVGQGDTPIYEAEFLNTQRVRPAAAPAPPAPPLPAPLRQALTARLCPRPRRHRPRCAAPPHLADPYPCPRPYAARGHLAPQPVHHPRRARHGGRVRVGHAEHAPQG